MIFELDIRSGHNPLWWRTPVWLAILAASVVQTHHLADRIAGGIVLAAGFVTFQFVEVATGRLRVAVVAFGVATGLAACLLMPGGLAEILVLVAASRAPRALDGQALRWFTVVATVGFAVTIAVIAHSLAGALAGVGIPLLIQRSVEHQNLIRERDRAQALLAEVQAGREAETQAAALRERGRIAREMHDVLAHSLAGLSVQLQAVRAVAAREKVGPVVLEPLDKAAALAREGLSEARAAVSTLRDPVGLGLDDLARLVERHPGRAGLTTSGTAGAVAPEAGHAVYRAVQEAMTNSARYAPGSAVSILLEWEPGQLTVTATDDGPAPGRTAVTGQGSGLGLAGMTERVTSAGGTVSTGPRAGRGWQTVIEVPTEASDGSPA